MKNFLLLVIAGLVVINAANAGIKETCLEHPDKLVWVEKTQRCIPINPCTSDDEDIRKAYCVSPDFRIPVTSNLPKVSDGAFLSLVLKKYFQNVMNTNIDSIRLVSPLYEHYVAVTTDDNGYYVMDFDTFEEPNIWAPHDTLYMEQLYKATCWSYGKIATNAGTYTNFEMKCDDVTETQCENIIDFANVLLQSIGGSGRIVSRYNDELRDYSRCYMAIYAY